MFLQPIPSMPPTALNLSPSSIITWICSVQAAGGCGQKRVEERQRGQGFSPSAAFCCHRFLPRLVRWNIAGHRFACRATRNRSGTVMKDGVTMGNVGVMFLNHLNYEFLLAAEFFWDIFYTLYFCFNQEKCKTIPPKWSYLTAQCVTFKGI